MCRRVLQEGFTEARRRQVAATLEGQMTTAQRNQLRRQLDTQGGRILAELTEAPPVGRFDNILIRTTRHSLLAWHPYFEQGEQTYDQRIEEYDQRAKEASARAERAAARAMELLRSHLSLDQLGSLDEHHYFDVTTQSGRRFRIVANGGVTFNMEDLATGHRYCCTPSQYGHYTPAGLFGMPAGFGDCLPWPDVVLGQKLALELDEADFLSQANVSRAAPPRDDGDPRAIAVREYDAIVWGR